METRQVCVFCGEPIESDGYCDFIHSGTGRYICTEGELKVATPK